MRLFTKFDSALTSVQRPLRILSSQSTWVMPISCVFLTTINLGCSGQPPKSPALEPPVTTVASNPKLPDQNQVMPVEDRTRANSPEASIEPNTLPSNSPMSKLESAPGGTGTESDSSAKDGSADSKDSSDSSNSSGSSGSGKSPRKAKPLADADSTLKSAQGLREKARRASNEKQFGNAFQLTSQAWEASRAHPKDARLKQLSDELLAEMTAFGKQANEQFGGKVRSASTRLIEK